jgi:hypothetical protein
MKLLIKITAITLFPFIIGISMNQNEGAAIDENKLRDTYPEHIAGAYTGGFEEQSCHSCHFDYDLNQPEGELSVSGIEESFEAGQEYAIKIRVNRIDMSVAGFQMTARFEDGSQAGKFEIDDKLTTTPNIESSVTYVQHAVGMVDAENGEKSWQITWTAPNQATQPIIFNIAANAANGDASAFGDWIYLKEMEIEPAQ